MKNNPNLESKLNKNEYFIPFYGIAKFYQNTKEERKNPENNRVIKDALSEIALIQAVGIAFLLYGGISLYQCIEKWF